MTSSKVQGAVFVLKLPFLHLLSSTDTFWKFVASTTPAAELLILNEGREIWWCMQGVFQLFWFKYTLKCVTVLPLWQTFWKIVALSLLGIQMLWWCVRAQKTRSHRIIPRLMVRGYKMGGWVEWHFLVCISRFFEQHAQKQTKETQ